MTRYLLDTSFCVHFIRGHAWARTALGRLHATDVAVSAVTVGALYEGAFHADSPSKELIKVEAFLDPLEVVPLGREETIQWGRIEAQLRKQGNPIEAEDGMIAATALAHAFRLVSSNLRHFERVKGLDFVDWETHPPKAHRG